MGRMNSFRQNPSYLDPPVLDVTNGCARLVTELVGALADLGGLDCLGHERLASIVAAVSERHGSPGSFQEQVTMAWELARPPDNTDLELIEAGQWDCGLIDWGVDEDLASDHDEACWAVAS